MRSVSYLGFIFGVHGIRADPDKLAAVHDIPVPCNRKQVRQFLGFANFYRRFLPPNFSSIIAPLTALTSEKNPFKWTCKCRAAFDRVKLLLTSTPVLVHPNFDLPFHILLSQGCSRGFCGVSGLECQTLLIGPTEGIIGRWVFG